MKSYLLSTATAVVALLATSASANTLYFQMNPNLSGSGEARQAFIFGAAGATGTVTGGSGFSQAFDLGPGGFAVVNVPKADELVSGTVESKGFRIEASTNVSGYFLSRRSATTDMTYLIDGDRLGKEYVVAGYQNIFEDQMSVQATQDNTKVSFQPKSGSAFDVTLNAGQTYMFTANSNLTGSRIIGDKPIAVFSGNRCTNVPTGVSACDHLVEQMPSIDLLSSTYLVAQTPRTGVNGNVVRVVATQDNTEVKFNGAVVATLNAGAYYEGRIAGGVQIDASNKVLVAQYLIGQTEAGVNTDPAMTIVPGSDQWLKSYVFASPSGTADFPTDFVSIVIGTADLGTLLIDGALADTSGFNALSTTAFSFGNIDVSLKSGPFSISAANPFQLLLSGFDSFDSYFTYGGAAFSPGASPPPIEPPIEPPPIVTQRWHWDGDAMGNANNGVVNGGDGTWSAATTNFVDPNGVSNGIYAPQPGTVVFTGTPGVVTVDNGAGAIAVAGMQFLVGGYRLTNGTIALAGSNAAIQVGDGTPAGAAYFAQIDTLLTGTAGLTKTDLGTLVLTSPNSYSGGTTIDAGTLIGNVLSFGSGAIVNNGTLVLDQTPSATYSNGISGTGRLFKNGTGTLTLLGTNDLSGGTWVEKGKLVVDGTLSKSVVTVRNGTALGGSGTVGGVVAETGSTVAPGTGLGTLNVAGNYSQRAGSTYDVEVTSAGLNDKIVATGTASLTSGAIIKVTKLDAPRYLLGTKYNVLSAAGGVTGTYTVTGNTKVSRFLDIVATYDAKNVYLGAGQTSSFASAGSTPNQIAAASGADSAGNGALYGAIAYLQTDAEAQDAFDQISGEIHATLGGALFEDSRFIREAVVNHLLAGGEDLRRGMWFHGYGSWGSFDGDGNAADAKRDIGGFFIGADFVNSEAFTLGVVGGYGTADIRVDDRNSTASTDDWHVGAYGDFEAAGFGGRFGIGHMWRNVNTQRSVAFTGYSDALTAEYQQTLFQMFGDVGYTFDLGGFGIEPFGALAYVKLDSDGFQEAGRSAALSSADGVSDDYWVTTLGGRVSIGLPVGSGNFGLTAMAGWRHASGGDMNTPVTLRFASGPGFDIAGPPIAEDAAALALAISAKIGPNVDFDLGYSGQVGQGLNDHGVRGAVSFRF